MKLSDLKSASEMTFREVPCSLVLPYPRLLSYEGRIVSKGANRFLLITNAGSSEGPETREFQVMNELLAREINNHFAQRQVNLALVRREYRDSLSPKERMDIDSLTVDIVFFHTTLDVGTWYVTLDESIRKSLGTFKLPNDESELDLAVQQNFLLQVTGRGYFAITIGKYDPNEFFTEEPLRRIGERKKTEQEETDTTFDAEISADVDPQTGADATADADVLTEMDANVDTNTPSDMVAATASNTPSDAAATADTKTPSDTMVTSVADTQAFVESLNRPADEVDSSFSQGRKIVLYGERFSLVVQVQGAENEEILRAIQVDKSNRRRPPMVLARGQLSFRNHESHISQQMRERLSSIHGYLELWSRYTNTEGDFLLKRARLIGLFSSKNMSNDPKGLLLYPKGLTPDGWKNLKTGDSLSFSSEIPPYLLEELSWEDYQAYQRSLEEASKEYGAGRVKKPKNDSRRILEIRMQDECILLERKEYLHPHGEYIFLDIYANEVQIQRRENARQRIDNAESANPALGLLIEGQLPGQQEDAAPRTSIEPMSALVQEKIFKHEPTPTQVSAIRMALNTPDIALIQGPPGTGKTTVITAIIERLNEDADHTKDSRGSVLVTSFQHDAVRNVVSRLEINALPTVKFGRKEGDQNAEEMLEDWRRRYAARLREKNPGLQETEEQKTLNRLRTSYIASPDDEKAWELLRFARSCQRGVPFIKDIENLESAIEADQSSDRADSLPETIRRLRTTAEGFADDGPENAEILLHELKRKFAGVESDFLRRVFQILSQAADGSDTADDSLLNALRDMKQELLRRCLPQPPYQAPRPRQAILDLSERLYKSMERPETEQDTILCRLLQTVEYDPARVRNSIAAYNFVYAATTQQSQGADILRAKQLKKDELPVYDTVIIDEAARVNPGDLLIPMSQARRRIILVGDHRQLPHVYDEEIFESMQADGAPVDRDIVTESMFQYLIEKAKKLTEQDQIPRVLTLNAQYRTHPLLGNFINECFYAPYGESFSSPRPASDFIQHHWHKPLKWVDFPDRCGKSVRSGTSRERVCEADYIARTLAEYLNAPEYSRAPEAERMKYGVITFYSAQKKRIEEALRRLLGPRSDLIRVGSVDAFQGMEFDVMFLSVVRCREGANRVDVDWDLLECDETRFEKGDPKREEILEARRTAGIKHYGFLTSENRLCVALSRQIRLMIVVGDAGVFTEGEWGRLAETCIPAMKRLVKLCQEEEVLVDGQP